MTEAVILAAGALEATLAPCVGGSVARFDCNGRPLFRPSPDVLTDVLEAGCFPMVPYVNRVRDGRFTFRGRDVRLDPMPGWPHPLHGHGWRKPWRVLSASLADAVLAFSHAADDWPWSYEAKQAFRLDETGLSVVLSVVNQSTEPMPAGLGLHPYFPCNGSTLLDAEVDHVWTVDAEVMPVERRRADGRYALSQRRICGADLDNGYDGFGGAATIRWADRELELRMTAPAARFLQVYAPPEGGLFVAEAVTHANAVLNLPEADAEALGLKILAPGETFAVETRFEVRPVP